MSPTVVTIPGDDSVPGKVTPDQQVVVFTAPDFTALATWLGEIGEWRDAVLRCSQVKTPVLPGIQHPPQAKANDGPVHDVFYVWDDLYHPDAVDPAFGYNGPEKLYRGNQP